MATYTYITNTGTIVPDTSNTRDEVIAEYRTIFGSDFIVDDESPEGLLINAETTSRQSVARNNAAIANQINPNLAGGPFLDAIWSLTGGGRTNSTRSTVDATITGVVNTEIPAGSKATSTNNDQFETVSAVTITASGTLENVKFRSVETGSIPVTANTLTTVSGNVLGWETVNNPTSGSIGRQTEGDELSRLRRRFELGLQGRSTSQAVIANLLALPDVVSLAFLENVTDSTMTIEGIILVAHSIWVSVQGGLNNDIAEALLRSKTSGANWNGAQSVNVIDEFSTRSYLVRFDRPTTLAMQIRVTVTSSAAISDPVSAVRDALEAYANNNTAEIGFVIGRDVSPFELSGAINQASPELFVTLVEVAEKSDNPTYQSTIFNINTNQLPIIETSGDIIVLVVQ